MKTITDWSRRHPRLVLGQVVVILVVLAALTLKDPAMAAMKLSIDGYMDFGYPSTVVEPTDGRPEHKLWYNDGLWWAVMYSSGESAYTIHKLEWSTQTWVDTLVWVDDRIDSRSDVLWDGTKLYIASYFQKDNPSPVTNPDNWGRLYRYSYNDTTDVYSLDSGFPVVGITEDKTNTLSLEKDSTGRLWVAYVSRPSGISTEYQVYVNSSGADDSTWNTPVSMTSFFATDAMVNWLDGAALIAFNDNGGDKVGIMWSNEMSGVDSYFFATHLDSSAYNTDWVLDTDDIPYSANDHISLAKTSTGEVFAALKTSAVTAGEALIAVMTRDRDGAHSFHTINPVESLDTKPRIAVYEPSSGPDKVYVFMTSNSAGGVVCAVESEITSPVSSMSFPVGSCGSQSMGQPRIVIGDETVYTEINNVTTTRQILDETSDIVLLATDQDNDIYVHTVVIRQLPAVIDQSPEPGSALYAADVIINAAFDMEMDDSTITTSSFQVLLEGSPIAGVVSYNPANWTATFAPDASLVEGVQYTVNPER